MGFDNPDFDLDIQAMLDSIGAESMGPAQVDPSVVQQQYPDWNTGPAVTQQAPVGPAGQTGGIDTAGGYGIMDMIQSWLNDAEMNFNTRRGQDIGLQASQGNNTASNYSADASAGASKYGADKQYAAAMLQHKAAMAQIKNQYTIDKATLGLEAANLNFTQRQAAQNNRLNERMVGLQEAQGQLSVDQFNFGQRAGLADRKMGIMQALADRRGPQNSVGYEYLLNNLNAPEAQASGSIDPFSILEGLMKEAQFNPRQPETEQQQVVQPFSFAPGAFDQSSSTGTAGAGVVSGAGGTPQVASPQTAPRSAPFNPPVTIQPPVEEPVVYGGPVGGVAKDGDGAPPPPPAVPGIGEPAAPPPPYAEHGGSVAGGMAVTGDSSDGTEKQELAIANKDGSLTVIPLPVNDMLRGKAEHAQYGMSGGRPQYRPMPSQAQGTPQRQPMPGKSRGQPGTTPARSAGQPGTVIQGPWQAMKGRVPHAEDGGTYGTANTTNLIEWNTYGDGFGDQPFWQQNIGNQDSSSFTGFGASLDNPALGIEGAPSMINLQTYRDMAPSSRDNLSSVYEQGLSMDMRDILERSRRAAPFGTSFGAARYG